MVVSYGALPENSPRQAALTILQDLMGILLTGTAVFYVHGAPRGAQHGSLATGTLHEGQRSPLS